MVLRGVSGGVLAVVAGGFCGMQSAPRAEVSAACGGDGRDAMCERPRVRQRLLPAVTDCDDVRSGAAALERPHSRLVEQILQSVLPRVRSVPARRSVPQGRLFEADFSDNMAAHAAARGYAQSVRVEVAASAAVGGVARVSHGS